MEITRCFLLVFVVLILVNSFECGFLPFGRDHRDKHGRKGDDVVSCIPVSSEFLLFSTKEHFMCCYTSNGYIMVDEFPLEITVSYPTTKTLLVPYNVDLVSNGLDTFHRNTKDEEILSLIDRDVAKKLQTPGHPTQFKSKEAVIITFNNVHKYGKPNIRFKYQVIIVTDYTNTFTVLNYERLDEDSSTVIGFIDPLACKHTAKFFDYRDHRTLLTTSNVGEAGKHVFLLTVQLQCQNSDVFYPWGKIMKDERIITKEVNLQKKVTLKNKWPLFSKEATSLTIFTHGYIGIQEDKFVPSSDVADQMSWFVPFYQGYRVTVKVFYRETSEPALLSKAKNDIREPGFKVSNLFLVTFQSTEQTFQMVLATDGKTTYAIVNYKELNYEAAGDVEVNEVGCQTRRIFIKEINSNHVLMNGNSTGVKGRHIFKLSGDGCFVKILGLRVFQEDIVLTKPLLNNYKQTITSLFTAKEIAKVAFHLKEVISQSASVAFTFLESSQTTQQDFTSSYGVFSSTKDKDTVVKIVNLFVMEDTPKTTTFQYGNTTIHQLESGIRCKYFAFNMKMRSMPTLKINVHTVDGSLDNLVNVWLKNVSVNGFEICAKEMFDFSGVRDVQVHFVAVTKDDENIEEAAHLIINHQQSNDKRAVQCFDYSFKKYFFSIPDVFTSVESLDGSHQDSPIIVWTKSISKTETQTCIKAHPSSRSSNYKIHLLIKGDLTPCNDFQCPDNLECQFKADLKPFCGCIKRSCDVDDNNKLFCGSDFKDHDSVCSLNKQHCGRFGPQSKSNITVLHYGRCQAQTIQSGITKMGPVANHPGLFCQCIQIDRALSKIFQAASSRLHVLLSVESSTSKTTDPHKDYSVWSEKVSNQGFRACVLVTNGTLHEDHLFKPPSVHWSVFPKEFLSLKDDGPAIKVGAKYFDTRTTDTQCQTIFNMSTTKISFATKYNVLTSIELTSASSLDNHNSGMTVWTDVVIDDQDLLKRTDAIVEEKELIKMKYIRVCVKGLQNQDMDLQGVVVHWLAIPSNINIPREIFIPEQIEVKFTDDKIPLDKDDSVKCKEIYYNLNYPSLNQPTVIIGAVNRPTSSIPSSSSFDIHSNHSSYRNPAVWIQNLTRSQLTVCMKHQSPTIQPTVTTSISVLVYTNLCEGHGIYHNGNCYLTNKQSPSSSSKRNCSTFMEADLYCKSQRSSLPVISSEKDSFHLREYIQQQQKQQHSSVSFWLNMERSNHHQLQWKDGSPLHFTRWISGEPGNRNCSVAFKKGWKTENCLECHNTVCQKEVNLVKRSCEGFCLNGGICKPTNKINDNQKVVCDCPRGFSGSRCHIDVSMIKACVNYTTHSEGWRNINHTLPTTTIQPNTTSCDARYLMDGEWHRFTGQAGTKLYTQCPDTKNICGTKSPGWVEEGENENESGSIGVSKIALLHFNSHYCAADFGSVEIMECGSFTTYKFLKIPYWSCDYGLCTM